MKKSTTFCKYVNEIIFQFNHILMKKSATFFKYVIEIIFQFNHYLIIKSKIFCKYVNEIIFQLKNDFQISNFQIPEKLEIWNSEFKIKLSDLNWVGKIPNILKLAKTSQFLAVSRFPDFQFPNSRNFQMSSKVAKN